MPSTQTKEEDEDVGSFVSCDSLPQTPRSQGDTKAASRAPSHWGDAALPACREDEAPADALPSSWGAMDSTDSQSEELRPGGANRLTTLKNMLPGFCGGAPRLTGSAQDDDIPDALRPQAVSPDFEASASTRDELPSHWGMPEVEASAPLSFASAAAPGDGAGPLKGIRNALSGLRGGAAPSAASPEKVGKLASEATDDDIPEALRPKKLSEGAEAELNEKTAVAAEQMPGHWGMADSEERKEEPTALPSPRRFAGLRTAVASRLGGNSVRASVDVTLAKSALVEEPDQYEIPEGRQDAVPSHWGMSTQDEDKNETPSHWGMPTQDHDEKRTVCPNQAVGIGSRLAGLKNVIPGLGGRLGGQEVAAQTLGQVGAGDDDHDIPESIRPKKVSMDSADKAAAEFECAAEQMPGHWGMAQAPSEDDADIIAATPENAPSHWGMTKSPEEDSDDQENEAARQGPLAGLKRVISSGLRGGGNSEVP